jgi:hypothetical protein
MEDLTLEKKQQIVDELNSSIDTDADSNLNVSTIADDPEAKAKLDQVSPRQLYESQIAANFRSTYILGQLAQKLSKKNLIKLLMFTCKLPEEEGFINFGGTKEQQKDAENAFIQAQVASNAKTFILSIDAAARSKMEKNKQSAQESQQGESNEQ